MKLMSTMQTVDMATGAVVAEDPVAWHLAPPPAGVCPICAFDHAASEPHNAQSLYYQMAFEHLNGRAPTWADAAAHCVEAVQVKWRRAFRTLGHAWTEPPAGVATIEHHGQGPDKP